MRQRDIETPASLRSLVPRPVSGLRSLVPAPLATRPRAIRQILGQDAQAARSSGRCCPRRSLKVCAVSGTHTISQCLPVSMSPQVSCLRSLVSPSPLPPLAPHWLALAPRGRIGEAALLPLLATGTPQSRSRPTRSRFAVRAPCAHQRPANASHKATRFQKRAGHGRGPRKPRASRKPFPSSLVTRHSRKRPEKGVRFALKLFSIFFPNPLARPDKM